MPAMRRRSVSTVSQPRPIASPKLALLPLTVAFVAIIFSSVLTRFVFHYPIVESVELSRLAFVWAMCLASAIGVYRHAHVAIFNLRDRMPPAWRRGVVIVVHLLCAAFGGLMAVYGIGRCRQVFGVLPRARTMTVDEQASHTAIGARWPRRCGPSGITIRIV